jgi:hypothetical protein
MKKIKNEKLGKRIMLCKISNNVYSPLFLKRLYLLKYSSYIKQRKAFTYSYNVKSGSNTFLVPTIIRYAKEI